ncbi:MAG: hypothetical protein F4X57_00270 [Chloroflexi bacterium]|nr:hypothetical protein [Chloroflexota bacterium]
MLMLIAATVILAVFRILTYAPDGKIISPLAAPLASIVTLATIAVLLLRAPRGIRLWSPIIGIVVGCIVALPFGLYDSSLVVESPWIGFPEITWPGLELTPSLKFWAVADVAAV